MSDLFEVAVTSSPTAAIVDAHGETENDVEQMTSHKSACNFGVCRWEDIILSVDSSWVGRGVGDLGRNDCGSFPVQYGVIRTGGSLI